MAKEELDKAALDAEVHISLDKQAGETSFKRSIKASSAAEALKGIAILVTEYANVLGVPVQHVVVALTTLLLAPAVEGKEDGKADE